MSIGLILLFGAVGSLLALLIVVPPIRARRAPSQGHPTFGYPQPQDVTEIYDRGARDPHARPILQGYELAQQYKGRPPVLKNSRIELFPGELVCIVGENGRGKSTLLKMLALDETPKHGDILIGGVSVWKESARWRTDMRARGISFIHPPQDSFGLMPWSPERNIMHWLIRLDGSDYGSAKQRARAALDRVDRPRGVLPATRWSESIDISRKNFSGGQLARIAIAGAIALQRPICLADEPLATLDPDARIEVLRLFREMADSGVSVAVVAHVEDQHLLEQYFDRILRVGPAPGQQTS
jgi:ABC-type lipoprotein export system ATPase subunit